MILGLLLPTSDDPQKDRDIFLKILTMDEEGLWRRKSKAIALKDIYARLMPYEREQWFDPESSEALPKLKKGITSTERQAIQRLVFMRLYYDEKLTYCDRPEQIPGPSEATWTEINTHLGTNAHSLPELVHQLGERRFGHVPRVGDAFCGGGSVPFEAARLGCEAYGSDLNPVAALLTWAALHITGGGEDTARQVQEAQRAIFTAVDQQVTEWGIEHNEQDWRADAYLYCVEVICPECGWRVPLAPSWVIGEKTRAVARLVPDDRHQRFEIDIHAGVSDEEMQDARKKSSTVKNSRLECPHCRQSTPIDVIRRHLRLWENDDLIPRPNDVFQERLYCIRWCLPNLERLLCIEQILQYNDSEAYGDWTLVKARTAIDSLRQFVTNEASNQIAVARVQTWPSEAHLVLNALAELKDLGVDEEATDTERLEAIRELGRARKALPSEVQPIIEISKNIPERTYHAPTEADLAREQKVLELLGECFHEWKAEGYLPSRRIESGAKTDEPIRTRGWTHWYHLFTPRQLLVHGLLIKGIFDLGFSTEVSMACILGIGRCGNWNSRLCVWDPHPTREKIAMTFLNQAFNTLYNFAGNGLTALKTAWFYRIHPSYCHGDSVAAACDARMPQTEVDIWITDPPYADAVNYHELSEFFLALYEKHLLNLFPAWYTDSKRALAITGSNETFRKSMVDCYRNLATHMPDDGLQIVMFTHQNASVWADLALILWASGLRVTAAWTIATETESALKEGNYVQGTVLLVLRFTTGHFC